MPAAADPGAGARYGVGTPPDVFGFVLGVMTPVAGFVIAIAIAIVVAVRRASHRRRLTATPYG